MDNSDELGKNIPDIRNSPKQKLSLPLQIIGSLIGFAIGYYTIDFLGLKHSLPIVLDGILFWVLFLLSKKIAKKFASKVKTSIANFFYWSNLFICFISPIICILIAGASLQLLDLGVVQDTKDVKKFQLFAKIGIVISCLNVVLYNVGKKLGWW